MWQFFIQLYFRFDLLSVPQILEVLRSVKSLKLQAQNKDFTWQGRYLKGGGRERERARGRESEWDGDKDDKMKQKIVETPSE